MVGLKNQVVQYDEDTPVGKVADSLTCDFVGVRVLYSVGYEVKLQKTKPLLTPGVWVGRNW